VRPGHLVMEDIGMSSSTTNSREPRRFVHLNAHYSSVPRISDWPMGKP
jgi:hypothetical protein